MAPPAGLVSVPPGVLPLPKKVHTPLALTGSFERNGADRRYQPLLEPMTRPSEVCGAAWGEGERHGADLSWRPSAKRGGPTRRDQEWTECVNNKYSIASTLHQGKSSGHSRLP